MRETGKYSHEPQKLIPRKAKFVFGDGENLWTHNKAGGTQKKTIGPLGRPPSPLNEDLIGILEEDMKNNELENRNTQLRRLLAALKARIQRD